TTFGFPGIFHVVRCRGCGLLYTNPRVHPEDVNRFFPRDYSAHAPDRAIRQKHRAPGHDPWDRLPEIGQMRLLDGGCGRGAYLFRQKQRGWTVFGVDPSENAVQAARAHGLEVAQGVIPGAVLRQHQFEVITLRSVIGFLPDPMSTLVALRTMLVPGGVLIVSAHNAASRAAGLFGPDWEGWDLPRHQSHFTPDTLTRLLEKAGFHNVRLSWRRRKSRWRHSGGCRAARTGLLAWRLLAHSRTLCNASSFMMSRGSRSDEMIAMANA